MLYMDSLLNYSSRSSKRLPYCEICMQPSISIVHINQLPDNEDDSTLLFTCKNCIGMINKNQCSFIQIRTREIGKNIHKK